MTKGGKRRLKKSGTTRLRSSARSTRRPQRATRRHDSAAQPDQRTPFARDRDRVLYCDAFRRLAGVTQVVHAGEGHVFHNRLTHTIKVAQIARRLAEHLGDTQAALAKQWGGLDPEVAEAAALVHDLGHPPFGHIAEEEMNEYVQQTDVDGFEGNAQSFRIVTKLAVRQLDEPGLNLTRATLNAILKYPWFRGADGKAARKWGAYQSESEDFAFAREGFKSGERSLEAEVMDWADDVAYAVHDVVDFYRARMLPLDLLASSDEEVDRFLEASRQRADSRVGSLEGQRAVESLLRNVPPSLLSPFRGTPDQRAEIQAFAAMLIKRYVKDAVKIARPGSSSPLEFHQGAKLEVEVMMELMRWYVFRDPALTAQQAGQRRVVRELLACFAKAVERGHRTRSIVPSPYRESLELLDKNSGSAEDDKRERTRTALDIVASLTEQQAVQMHRRLIGHDAGSVWDPIWR